MNDMEYANTYVQIDLDAIEANFQAVKELEEEIYKVG